MILRTIHPADPFDYDRLYHFIDKFQINNMELNSFNLFDLQEHAISVYSDDIRTDWDAALPLVESQFSGDAFFAGATAESFMAFARKIGEMIGIPFDITGARIVRFTNHNQWPVLRLDLVGGAGKNKARQFKSDFEFQRSWGR